jgi:hypothetical protein
MKYFILLMLSLTLVSCATPLQTMSVQRVSDDEGRFNLIYLVGVKSNDVRNAVVLDRLGDEYEFVPEVRDFDYEILQDISIQEALLESDVFFRSFPFITGADLHGIADKDGNIIGYELKPFYNVKYYGVENVLNIDYTVKSDNLIAIDIGIKFGLVALTELPPVEQPRRREPPR